MTEYRVIYLGSMVEMRTLDELKDWLALLTPFSEQFLHGVIALHGPSENRTEAEDYLSSRLLSRGITGNNDQ